MWNKDGDEVLVSSSTNMACAFSIACAMPTIPIDVKKDNWIIDTSLIEEKINKKTKAIMVVHLFGHTVDMDIVMISQKNMI